MQSTLLLILKMFQKQFKALKITDITGKPQRVRQYFSNFSFQKLHFVRFKIQAKLYSMSTNKCNRNKKNHHCIIIFIHHLVTQARIINGCQNHCAKITKQYLHSLKLSLYRLPTNYNKIQYFYTVEKPHRYYHNPTDTAYYHYWDKLTT